MKYQQYIIAICLYCCCIYQAPGQIHGNAIPFSATENLAPITDFMDLPAIDSSLCKDATAYAQFACPIYTDLDPHNSGQWTETPGGSVWRLGIQSGNAYSLYISMHYSLSSGARMFVYGPGYQDLRGAFTSRNNNSAQVLSIAPVRGDRLIIELNLPTFQYSFGEIKTL